MDFEIERGQEESEIRGSLRCASLAPQRVHSPGTPHLRSRWNAFHSAQKGQTFWGRRKGVFL